MNEDIEILKKNLADMAGILNAVAGERFDLKCSQTLLIVQRRMSESDLLRELSVYTGLFSKDTAPGIMDLSYAAVSFVKIKTLCEEGKENFDEYSKRSLIKEFQAQKTKVMNIINLSRVNLVTADDYQKEVIEKTLNKSEMYLKAFECEIANLEAGIEKEPESTIKEEVREEEPVKKEVKPVPKRKVDLSKVLDKVSSFVKGFKRKKEIIKDLKEEEAKHSDAECEEIPFYDSALHFDESHVCKDIPEFSLFKRKGNIYFGLTGNIKGSVYDNHDRSLYELMNAGEDFIQFVSCDLLSGEYDLTVFSETEKQAMRLYFNFICVCFEKHIGKKLSVKEYLQFKDYYNRLILKSLSLEADKRSRYYRALEIADDYLSYMKGYDLSVSDSKEEIIEGVLSGKNLNYLGDLELILNNHVVSNEAKESLEELMAKIRDFDKKIERKAESEAEIITEPVKIDGAKIVLETLSGEGKILDEALYSIENLNNAANSFLGRKAALKRIGIEKAGKRVYFFEAKDGDVCRPIENIELPDAFTEKEKLSVEGFRQTLLKTMIQIGGI